MSIKTARTSLGLGPLRIDGGGDQLAQQSDNHGRDGLRLQRRRLQRVLVGVQTTIHNPRNASEGLCEVVLCGGVAIAVVCTTGGPVATAC